MVLNEDIIGDEDIEYDDEGMPLTPLDRENMRLSQASSLERLNPGDRNSMGKQMMKTEQQA